MNAYLTKDVKKIEEIVLDENAVKIAMKVLKKLEGCNLIAYPDPDSDLYKALSLHNMLGKYMHGEIKYSALEAHFKALSATPWTCGYGSTEGVTKDNVWTQQEADSKLEDRVRSVMAKCLKSCPQLVLEHSERIAAITSMTYNIGDHAFAESTACRLITEGKLDEVADSMMLWNKPSMVIGRRTIEVNLWKTQKV